MTAKEEGLDQGDQSSPSFACLTEYLDYRAESLRNYNTAKKLKSKPPRNIMIANNEWRQSSIHRGLTKQELREREAAAEL